MRVLEIESIWDKNGDNILNRKSEHQELTFNVNHRRGFSKCYLFEDQAEDRIHILSVGACIKAQYTDQDYAEGERLSKELPLNHGDIVQIAGRFGKQYKVHVNGNYSDLGELIPIK
tara:strand:+ start:1639 stop:1986 length:348 start_codon:yes stop_codon:yes gene_type:complete